MERFRMLLAIVTEFPQGSNFQWSDAWNPDRQKRHGISIINIEMSPEALQQYPPPDHPRWKILKEADAVFVYVSRFCLKEYWEWFKLPVTVRTFLKPEAKMICQFDDELVWMIHPENEWWGETYDYKFNGDFERFFKEKRILDVADMYFTVLKNPWWAKYCTKPIRYMPLPQLLRYPKEYPYPRASNGNIATMRHMSRTGDADHLIKNVTNVLKRKVSYFSCSTSMNGIEREKKMRELEMPTGSFFFGFLFRDTYMEYLSHCMIGLDDGEHYYGWSRFVMECAFLNIPCISSNFAGELLFPELYVSHKNYERQKELIQLLFKDRGFYDRVSQEGKRRVFEQLNVDKLCNNFVSHFAEIGAIGLSPEELEFYGFIDFLRRCKTHVIPPKPSETSSVEDKNFYDIISANDWIRRYGHFEKFLNDRNLYMRARQILNNEGSLK